jgi:hypothetical protein
MSLINIDDKQEDKNDSDYLTKRFYDKNFLYGVGYSNNIEAKKSKFSIFKNLFKILKTKKKPNDEMLTKIKHGTMLTTLI